MTHLPTGLSENNFCIHATIFYIAPATFTQHSTGVCMRFGIEVVVVKDAATGKNGLRVWPYIYATPRQMRYIGSAITIGLFLGVIALLTSLTPDPIIEPTVTLFP